MVRVSNWITALSFYSLPLNELSSRRLAEKERNGTLSRDLKEQLTRWKKSIGLEDADDLEYKYFLEGIDAIRARDLETEDLTASLATGLPLGSILAKEPQSVKLYYLSRLGSMLAEYLSSRQHHLYEAALFWSLIRSDRFNPLIQRLLSDRRFYEIGLKDALIPSGDGISRNLVKKWLKYFDLLKEDILNRPKLVIMLLYSLAMEINEKVIQEGKLREYVEQLCRYASQRFSISDATIDISVLLDSLYSHIGRQVIAGFPSGRGHQGLPLKPTVQILEINEPIPLSNLEKIQAFDIMKAIRFGGNS
jgi:hypothetical protein